jgi:hypothetical protein
MGFGWLLEVHGLLLGLNAVLFNPAESHFYAAARAFLEEAQPLLAPIPSRRGGAARRPVDVDGAVLGAFARGEQGGGDVEAPASENSCLGRDERAGEGQRRSRIARTTVKEEGAEDGAQGGAEEGVGGQSSAVPSPRRKQKRRRTATVRGREKGRGQEGRLSQDESSDRDDGDAQSRSENWSTGDEEWARKWGPEASPEPRESKRARTRSSQRKATESSRTGGEERVSHVRASRGKGRRVLEEDSSPSEDDSE